MSACSRIQSRDRWATQDWPRSLPCGWLIATIVFTKMLLTGAVRIFPSTDIYIEDKSRFNPISIYCFVPYKGDTTWKYNGNLRKHYSDWSKCENSKIRAFCKNYINIPTFHEDYVGRYTCCDLHEGTNASINVGVVPEFVDPTANAQIVEKGHRVEMTCFIRDYVLPKALVSWFAQDGSRYKNVSTGPRFVINSSQLNDTGLYYCRAINNPKMRSATKAFHITVYEPVRCTSLRQIVVTGPKLNMSVEIVLEGSPLPTKSNIIPVPQWYIKENRNNSFIVVTKTVDHPVEASGQENILLTHQTVRSGINSRNITSICTVNISNEALDKYRESRNFCVTLQANIQNCLFKQVAPEAAKYFATISAVVRAGIGCTWQGTLLHVVTFESNCSYFRMYTTFTTSVKCDVSPNALLELLQSWSLNQTNRVEIRMPASSNSIWYCKNIINQTKILEIPRPTSSNSMSNSRWSCNNTMKGGVCFLFVYCRKESQKSRTNGFLKLKALIGCQTTTELPEFTKNCEKKHTIALLAVGTESVDIGSLCIQTILYG